MPVIARFYGILIKMYFKEHDIPHFHAIYGEYNGVFKIDKIKSVKPLRGKRLLVTFQNNIQKIYDCSHLLKEEIFSPLKNDFLFKSAKVDQGGYGVVWNDEVDLSESEIWINGSLAEQDTKPDLAGAGRQTKPNGSRRKTGQFSVSSKT